jgi:hypothetical protein
MPLLLSLDTSQCSVQVVVKRLKAQACGEAEVKAFQNEASSVGM